VLVAHNPQKWKFSSEIQSLLFPLSDWSERSARTWAKAQGFKVPKTDVTTNYIRIRQRDPSQFSEFRTMELGDSGVKAVIGEPKRSPLRENKGWFGERLTRPEDRSKKLSTNARKRYDSSHWVNSENPRRDKPRVYEIPDGENLPDTLTKMGDLLEIKISRGPTLEFSPDSILAFSPRIDERMYNVLTPEAKKKAKKLIKGDKPWVSLTEAADKAGGRQADFTYPDIQVQVIGPAKHVIYHTEKMGDGPSDYIHTLGEESGTRPLLTVDKKGRLWFAGGNYSVPDEGITD